MALIVGVAAYLLPGVEVSGIWSAVIVALLLWLVNATLGFVLRFVTAPLNWVTLGLLSFVISVLLILLVDNLVVGFKVDGFWYAALFAIVVSVLRVILGLEERKAH
jgi:putative membrane protein